MGTARSLASRLRGALKAFSYSGLFRSRWQQPERVVEALAVERGSRVADLGAGGGYFTFRLARAVGPDGRVYAVDVDDDMRARMDRRARRAGVPNVVTVAPHDGAAGLPEPVDLILVVDAFHHLPEQRAEYFGNLADTLRPGGRIAVIEAVPRWFWFGHATDPAEIRSVMTAAGYEVSSEHDFLGPQSFLVFARR